MARSLVQEKSLAFALHVIEVYKQLQSDREFVLSRQLLRSGTSIGANIEEAIAAQSRKDFLSKMSVASKEARETRYWLTPLEQSRLTETNLESSLKEVDEIIRMLTAIVKTTAEQPSSTQNSKLKT